MIIRIPLLIGLLIGLLVSSSSSGGVPLHYANTLGLLELTFSLYGAELNDWDSLASIVLETSDFLCVEVGVRVQDDASCQSGGTATNQSVVALKTSTSVVEQGGSDKFNLEWTSWTEEFWILELSSEIIEQAAISNQDPSDFFQETVQQALELSIFEGRMNHQFQGTGVIWSVPGDEVETFETYLEEIERQNNHTRNDTFLEQELVEDFDPDDNHLLRILGSILLVLNTIFVTALNRAAKKRRKLRERLEEEAESRIKENDQEPEGGLTSEAGVEKMLQAGREGSLQLMGLSRSKNNDNGDIEIVLTGLGKHSSPSSPLHKRKQKEPEEFVDGSIMSSPPSSPPPSPPRSPRSMGRGSSTWSQIQRSPKNDGSFIFDP